MTLVVDASVVAAALLRRDEVGVWAEHLLTRPSLTAPHLMPAEVGSVLRRGVLAGTTSEPVASLAHGSLQRLPVALVPYAPCAERIWELRHAITTYDAWYVAIAEQLNCPLATVDSRLARSNGARCEFLLPPT